MSSRDPAPGALALVQRFVNTVDVEAREETFRTPGDLHAFLVSEGLLDNRSELAADDLARAVAVREGVRSLLCGNCGDDLDPAGIAALNEAAARSELYLRFDDDGSPTLAPRSDGLDAALGRLLAIVYTAMENGAWDRLKACRRDTCKWAFYDHSKNASGKWCTMDVCGSREKAKAYRRRHKEHA